MRDNVLVYGSGGRNQCLAEEYAESPHTDKVFVATTDPGVDFLPKAKAGHIIRVPIKDFKGVVDFCKEKNIKFVDVGSENPLSDGLGDILEESGIPAIAPKKEFARIESDRDFTDVLLDKIGVPKPQWRSFTDLSKAQKYVKNIGYQVVVKANGLAAGKGAIVCNDIPDALEAIDKIMIKKKFGESGNRVVVEERKYGEEISFFAYLDGKHVYPLRMFARDFKPAFDPEDLTGMFSFQYGLDGKNLRRGIHELKLKFPKGANIEKLSEQEKISQLEKTLRRSSRMPINPNTGGTGCYCPHELVQPWLVNKIIKEIVNPTTNEIYNQLGWNYKGVLYFGLNRDPDGNLDVFEINVRHGDPEWEVLGRKLKTDLYEIGLSTVEGTLDELPQEWNPNFYVDVVAMAGRSKDETGWYQGYPGRYGKGYQIKGLENVDRNVAIFYAGVDKGPDGNPTSNGGRVLHVVASSPESLGEASYKAYENIDRLKFIDHNHRNENCLRCRRTIRPEFNP